MCYSPDRLSESSFIHPRLMRAAMTRLNLSARAYHRILNLAGNEEIQSVHLAEALQYRPKLMFI